jgi:hypothetical protein
MSISVFNDKKLQEKFDKDGYIVVPFLPLEEVARLKNLYEEVSPRIPASFHSTSFSNDDALKRKISDEVEKIYSSKVATLFHDIKKLGSSFLTKPTGITGTMPVHQDWTVVDEEKFYSVTAWVPLQDVNENNGAIKVLPGSNRFSKTLRSPNIPNEFDGLSEVISKQMKTLNMKAGEALIFNHALLHASWLNQSSSPRIAVTYGLIPSQAKLYLYLKNEKGKLEKYFMPDDMFSKYTNIGKAPSCGEKMY